MILRYVENRELDINDENTIRKLEKIRENLETALEIGFKRTSPKTFISHFCGEKSTSVGHNNVFKA